MVDRKDPQRVRVLVADDHRVVAEGLYAVLEPEFDVIATLSEGNALVAAAATLTQMSLSLTLRCQASTPLRPT
jgi:DNA-binding NarL/FixJ family response regulator